jgi:enoyl-CoA hydratase/carnithine racemase
MATKRLLKGGQQAQALACMEAEGAEFARLLTAPAAREAITAFLEKRAPDFTGM